MSNLIRSFIAIPLSHEIHQNLANLARQHNLESPEFGLRLVKPENIHLTLKFTGDIESHQVPVISRSLDTVLHSDTPFTLEVLALGAFPGWKGNPRVIWVGIQPLEKLRVFQQKIESALHPYIFESEKRPFSPHLTLARVKQDCNAAKQKALFEKLMNLQPTPKFGSLTVDHVNFYRSLLLPAGPIYTILSQHKF